MSARFSFRVEPSRDLVRIEMAGLFTPADIDAFLEARRRAHAELRCGPNQHLTINDVRDMKIQSQDAVARFRELAVRRKAQHRRLSAPGGQRPSNSGFCFCRKANTARLKSSVRPASRWAVRSAASASESDNCPALRARRRSSP